MELQTYGIPVVMYHTVGRIIPDWKWSFLTLPASIFEDHLRWLLREGYQTVSLDDLFRHVAGEQTLPQRSVVLTFDDGYLDNWTYVAPLLCKYQCQGTVFVNPDFVDPRNIVRPTLQQVWDGQITEEELTVRGFMSWAELRHLTDNGPLHVECHAMTHTWYPAGPKVVDFHHPNDGYFWLDWNAFPAEKPFYLLHPTDTRVPFGAPIYEHQKSLSCTRYFPNPEEERSLIDIAKKNGDDFFTKEDWRERLTHEVDRLRRGSDSLGRYESEVERIERYRFELAASKCTLEEKLEHATKFLCWPGGGYDELARSIALELYAAVTLGSADPSPARNRPEDDPRFVRRCGVPSATYRGKVCYFGGRYLVQALKEYQGSVLARRYRQVLKVLALGREALSSIRQSLFTILSGN